jgi:hypothetical protein
MPVATVVESIQKEFFGALEVAVGPADASLRDLLGQLSDIDCTPEDLQTELRAISSADAATLIAATLHKGMAYSNEYMPLERANALAAEFVSAMGADPSFYSTTCIPAEPSQSIGAWYFIVSSHTFESVVYCKGRHESAFFLAIDED